MANIDAELAPYVSHADFCAGWPKGRFHVVVNPAKAWVHVAQRTHSHALSLGVLASGAVLGVAGHGVAGLAFVAVGVGLNRLLKHQAPKVVLHMALRNPQAYAELTSNGVMEVQAR